MANPLANKIKEDGEFLGFSSKLTTMGKADNSIDPADVAQADAMAKQLHVYKPGISFVPGAKLEVLDARDNKWYLCKVVEVDWGELDILVHYDRWSIRFDEWLKMDSTRIRQVEALAKKDFKTSFKVGERVWALWAADGKRYSAVITKIYPDDKCEILFDDGISKILKISNLMKCQKKDIGSLSGVSGHSKCSINQKTPLRHGFPSAAMPSHGSPSDAASSSSINIFKVEIIDEKRKPKRKPAFDELFESIKKRRRTEVNSSDIVERVSVEETNQSCKKSLKEKEMPAIVKETKPEKFLMQIESLEKSDDSTVVADTSLEAEASVKNEDDDDTKDDSELALSLSMSPDISSESIEKLDQKSLEVSVCEPANIEDKQMDLPLSDPAELIIHPPVSSQRGKIEIPIAVPKENVEVSMPLIPTTKIKRSRNKFYLKPESFYASSVTEPKDHLCPKEKCRKSFRKKNLLHMHIKHYHPELQKKGHRYSLNVADLAYARTVGDHLDSVSSHAIKMDQTPVVKEVISRRIHKSPGDSGLKVSILIPPKLREGKTKFKKKHKHKKEDKSQDELSLKPSPVPASSQNDGIADLDTDYKPFVESGKKRERGQKKQRFRKSRSHSESSNAALDDDAAENECLEPSTEIINCGCGLNEEEGLMLQCDICQCWQHGECYSIKEDHQVPEKYICSICDSPRLQRSSYKFAHHQDWLKEGRLPRFSFSGGLSDARLECCVRRGHELTANVLQLSPILFSLRLKLHIAKYQDHPKLVMWHKDWQDQADNFDVGISESRSNSIFGEDIANLGELLKCITADDFVQQQGSPFAKSQTMEFTGSTPVHESLLPSCFQKDISGSLECAEGMQVDMNSSSDDLFSPKSHSDHEDPTIRQHKIKEIEKLLVGDEALDFSMEQNQAQITKSDVLSVTPLKDTFNSQASTIDNDSVECVGKNLESEMELTATSSLPTNAQLNSECQSECVSIQKDEKDSLENPLSVYSDLVIDIDKKENGKTSAQSSELSKISKDEEEIMLGSELNTTEMSSNVTESVPLQIDSDKLNTSSIDIKTDEFDNSKSKGADIDSENESKQRVVSGDLTKPISCDSEEVIDDADDLDFDIEGLTAGADGAISNSEDLSELLASQPDLVNFVPNISSLKEVPSYPQAERIDPAVCRINLLKHVRFMQEMINKRFDDIDEQLKVLEAEMGLPQANMELEEERSPELLQARALVKVLSNDVHTVKKLSEFKAKS